MSEPCFKCGVRADIGCRHQPAEGMAPIQTLEPADPRKAERGQGLWAFHPPTKRQVSSIRGRLGNPTRREFEKLIRK